jgi:thioredoxin-related protein
MSVIRAQPALYNPGENADSAITAALIKAKAENKFVLLKAGGNWCSWCIKFEKFCKEAQEIDSLIEKNFIIYHLNWSKENVNRPIFKKYGYPQRFGFPVFIILDSNGNRIHTQNSEYLEDGLGSYSKIKVIMFFEMWSPWGLNPKMYGD